MKEEATPMRPDAEKGFNRGFPEFFGMRVPVSISSKHTGGCNFGMRDGSVAYISDVINKNKFRDLIRGTAKEMP